MNTVAVTPRTVVGHAREAFGEAHDDAKRIGCGKRLQIRALAQPSAVAAGWKPEFTEDLKMALPSERHEPDNTQTARENEDRALILKLRWLGLEQESVRRAVRLESPPGESMLGGTD